MKLLFLQCFFVLIVWLPPVLADAFGVAVERPDQVFMPVGGSIWSIGSQAPGTDWADSWIEPQGLGAISTVVAGPVSIYFESTGLLFSTGGEFYELADQSAHHLYLPAGQHALTWSGSGKLSRLYLEYNVSIGDALGVSSLNWTHKGKAFVPFLRHPAPGVHPSPGWRHSGQGVVCSEEWLYNDSNELSTVVDGPAYFNITPDFLVRRYYEFFHGGLDILINNTSAVPWRDFFEPVFVGGNTRAKIELAFDPFLLPVARPYIFWINSASFTPVDGVGLPGLWTGEFQESPYTWVAVANGGPFRNLQGMVGYGWGRGQLKVNGAARLSFWARFSPNVSLPIPPDFVYQVGFQLYDQSYNGTGRLINYQSGWQYFEFIMPRGAFTAEWYHRSGWNGKFEVSGLQIVPEASTSGIAFAQLVRNVTMDSDEDGDGVPLLLELIGGTNPIIPGPSGIIQETGRKSITFRIPRSPSDTAGIILGVEESKDLNSWRPIAAFQSVNDTHRVFQVTPGGETQSYFRLRVTLP